MLRERLLKVLVVAVAAGGCATGAAQARAAGPRDQILSNETAFTRWAHPAAPGPIHARADSSSPLVTRLHWFTEDRFPEIYLLLRAHWDLHGQEWVKLRIPMRPNGRTGWVRRQDLGALNITHQHVVVDRERLRLFFFVYRRLVWSAPIAVGKPSTPTPAGHFWIREVFKVSDPASGYWPYAFGTSDYSTLPNWPEGGLVGIHGPYFQNQEIPGRISHGCIRLHTGDDGWLGRHLQLGAPVDVR
ncbi:MAG: L,D-transpeptidase [Candidatus Dormibacteraeota bacterium]|nr:L,D-transpeptidase [Candidatus Dormibacteraeota bacterium]